MFRQKTDKTCNVNFSRNCYYSDQSATRGSKLYSTQGSVMEHEQLARLYTEAIACKCITQSKCSSIYIYLIWCSHVHTFAGTQRSWFACFTVSSFHRVCLCEQFKYRHTDQMCIKHLKQPDTPKCGQQTYTDTLWTLTWERLNGEWKIKNEKNTGDVKTKQRR